MSNLSSSLIGLTVLSGNSSMLSSVLSPTSAPLTSAQTKAMQAAMAAFTTPTTVAPWQADPSKDSAYRQLQSVLSLRSIVDTSYDPEAKSLPDVETAFTTYKALDKLRILAEEAAKSGTSASEREKLNTAFAKGLDDLKAYLSTAETEALDLYFDQPRKKVETMALPSENPSQKVTGTGVVKGRNLQPNLLDGDEFVRIDLTDSADPARKAYASVDLKALGPKPTKEQIADALNASLDAQPGWSSRFAVVDKKIVLQPSGTEQAKLKSAVPGIQGNEVFTVSLDKAKYGLHNQFDLDLATLTQPPTLDDIADALNAKIAAVPKTDVNGNVVLDGNGDPVLGTWHSRFIVEKTGDLYGLTFQAQGVESISLEQKNAADSITVVTGQSVSDLPDVTKVLRFDNVAGTPVQVNLGRISGTDPKATAQANANATSGSTTNNSANVDTSASAVVTDAQGFSYIVGKTKGAMGFSVSDGETDDLFLTKVDSEGKVVWQRLLGSAGEASGSAITLADNGDVIVAGSVRGFDDPDAADNDMLVARFDSNGDSIYAKAIGGSGEDIATSVTVGADGSVYVGGRTSSGGGDAFIATLDPQGRVQAQTTLPLSPANGRDSITAMATDADGNILALTNQAGKAVLLKLDPNDLSGAPLGSIDLGTADARAIAVSDNGEIAVVGSTKTAVATGSPQIGSLGGGSDGFVTRISGDSFSVIATSYIAADRPTDADPEDADPMESIDSAVYIGDTLYVGGRTTGSFNGTALRGDRDGFISRIGADGIPATTQFGVSAADTDPVYVAAAQGSSTVLGKLGLHRGSLNAPDNTVLTARTSLRVGDSFQIAVNGGARRDIVIEEGETLQSLSEKINTILGRYGTASTSRLGANSVLTIQAEEDMQIDILAGPDGQDVLQKLGMEAGRLTNPSPPSDTAPRVTPGGDFGLQLSGLLNLLNSTNAKAALGTVNSAISMTQTAYRSLYWDASKAALASGANALLQSGGSAYQQAQLANYQAALTRLSGGYDTTTMLM